MIDWIIFAVIVAPTVVVPVLCTGVLMAEALVFWLEGARARRNVIRSCAAASTGFRRCCGLPAARVAAAAPGARHETSASFENTRHANGRAGISARGACRARSARARCPPEIQSLGENGYGSDIGYATQRH